MLDTSTASVRELKRAEHRLFLTKSITMVAKGEFSQFTSETLEVVSLLLADSRKLS